MEANISTVVSEALRFGRRTDFAELAALCTEDLVFTSAVSSPLTGPVEVVSQLERFQAAGRFAKAVEWDSVTTEDGLKIIARLPLNAFYESYEWDITLSETGKIARLVQTGLAQTAPLPPSPVSLTDEIANALDLARETRNPLILAYVDHRGRPSQSPRGTTQVFGETRLALWNHNPEGGLISAIRLNANVSIHYWGGIGTAFGGALSFQGTATINEDPSVRDQVYERSPPSEQRSDPDRAGCAVIVDLERVSGFLAGTRYNMLAGTD